ncbi:hypothetical protein Bbelb_400480 [Branchiostoma belcheri]|nr:hypothetical protein Bbelb_400480 [Branchiostoma belcheri]
MAGLVFGSRSAVFGACAIAGEQIYSLSSNPGPFSFSPSPHDCARRTQLSPSTGLIRIHQACTDLTSKRAARSVMYSDYISTEQEELFVRSAQPYHWTQYSTSAKRTAPARNP